MGFVIRRRQVGLGLCAVALATFAAIYLAPRTDSVRESLPEKLSDAEFWKLVSEFSEPGGSFRSDNFVSNESAFQHVIPQLKKQIKPGGVYLGVGPDQNFTYIDAVAPKLAFIIDIRRQNMLQHLMYKALFELSDSRVEFLSKLFARPIPPELPRAITVEQLFEAFGSGSAEPALVQENLAAILLQLREKHHFSLAPDDSKNIEFVYRSFVSGGPEIRYSYPNQYAWRRFPSYSELMLETDGTGENGGGDNHSYMASEENFKAIKKLEAENRIVPVVGDFAGEKALRSVAGYLKENSASVTVFYTSNVEFYLFQTEDWKKFLNNAGELPVSKDSLFIRSYFNNYGSQFPNPPGWLYSPPQSYTLLDSMADLLADFGAGRIHKYFDVIRHSAP
jgi:hypothetical protein